MNAFGYRDGAWNLKGLALSVVIALTCVQTVFAQPPTDSFFGRGFASQVGTEDRKQFFEGSGSVRAPLTAPQNSARNKDTSEVFGRLETTAETTEQSTEQVSKTEAEIYPDAPKIKRIGAVLNGLAAGHIDRCLKELTAITKERELTLGTLYVVGIGDGYTKSTDIGEFVKAGGGIMDAWILPDYLPVKRSPTWLLETEQGLVLLEGVSLARYITPQGKFIDKGLSAPQVGSSF